MSEAIIGIGTGVAIGLAFIGLACVAFRRDAARIRRLEKLEADRWFGPTPKAAAVDACECRCDGDPTRCRSRPGGPKVKRD